MTNPAEWVAVARVRTVQAPRRELRLDEVAPYKWPNPAPAWVNIAHGGDAPKRFKVAAMAEEGGALVVVLAPGVPRETVAALRGAAVVLPEAEAESWRSGEWHAPEWVGYQVRDERAEVIGTVREVWAGAANAAFTVESANGEAWVLPAISEVVLEVDRAARVLTITGVEPHGIRHED